MTELASGSLLGTHPDRAGYLILHVFATAGWCVAVTAAESGVRLFALRGEEFVEAEGPDIHASALLLVDRARRRGCVVRP